jgi:hypothetical protein
LFGANLLAAGAADMAMRADPGFHAIFFRRAIGFDNDGTTGMVLSNLCDKLCILFQ